MTESKKYKKGLLYNRIFWLNVSEYSIWVWYSAEYTLLAFNRSDKGFLWIIFYNFFKDYDVYEILINLVRKFSVSYEKK